MCISYISMLATDILSSIGLGIHDMMLEGILRNTFPCPCNVNVIPAYSAGQFGSKSDPLQRYCYIAKCQGKVTPHLYTDITYVCRGCIHIIYLLYIICILPESICKSYVCVCLYVPSSFPDY